MGRSALLPARMTFHLQWIMGQSRTWPASRTTLLLISVPFFVFLSVFATSNTLHPLSVAWHMNHFTLSWVVRLKKNPFVFWLPAVQENKLSVTKAKRAVVNNHCLLCLSPLYRFAFSSFLSSSSVSCSAAVYVSTNILAPVNCCPPLTWLILIEARTLTF